jgi:hypothetical protein
VKEEGAECSFNLPCFSVKPETAKERERERLFFLFFFFLASFYVLMGEEVRESGAFTH